jgi:hypothetical protein
VRQHSLHRPIDVLDQPLVIIDGLGQQGICPGSHSGMNCCAESFPARAMHPVSISRVNVDLASCRPFVLLLACIFFVF